MTDRPDLPTTPPIAVSLLVHAHLDSAAALVANISRATGADAIAVHVSQVADFTPDDLARQVGVVPGVLVNPTRRELHWGKNIVDGHEANLQLLGKTMPSQTRVLFDASNDWYLRPVPRAMLEAEARFQRHLVHDRTGWLWAVDSPDAAGIVATWAASRGQPPVISQIEGAVYPLGWALHTLDAARGVLGDRLYDIPAEEYVWPVAAQELTATPRLPLIFTETVRYDAAFASVWNALRPATPPRLRKKARNVVTRSMDKLARRWALSPDDVRTVATSGTAPLPTELSDGGERWRPYAPGEVFGVKRVPLPADDPLRLLCAHLGP